jgi:imidazolonepropionase-like amidohydrolase
MKLAIKIFILVFIIITVIVLYQSRIDNTLAIINVDIINPNEKLVPRLGYVIIRGDKIHKVGYGKFEPTNVKTIVDAEGQYLIPGLIDSHVHLSSISGMDFEHKEQHPELVTQYFQYLSNSYLFYGFTTLIDLNPDERYSMKTFRVAAVNPDIYSCGGITMENGYPAALFPEDIRYSVMPNVIMEKDREKSLSQKLIIHNIKNQNKLCVKLFYQKSFRPELSWSVFDEELLQKLTLFAKQHELPVVAHANTLQAQNMVLDADVNIIAHGLWNWGELNNQKVLPEKIQATLDRIIEQKVGYQPTVQVIQGLRMLHEPSYLERVELKNTLPHMLVDWYVSDAGQWYKNAASKKLLTTFYHQGRSALSYLAKHDARLLFGSDTPSAPIYTNLPGYNGYLEMQEWIVAGVSLSKLFKALTIDNAKAFQLDHLYGSVASGKVANLLLLKKNPLESIEAYNSISQVIVRGKNYSREQFKIK